MLPHHRKDENPIHFHHGLVWRGHGLVVPLIFLGVATPLVFLAVQGTESLPGAGLTLMEGALIASPLLGGFSCVLLGRRLNRPRSLRHDFYFLRIEHWGYVSLAIGMLTAILFVGIEIASHYQHTLRANVKHVNSLQEAGG